jgi:hypothetical protein
MHGVSGIVYAIPMAPGPTGTSRLGAGKWSRAIVELIELVATEVEDRMEKGLLANEETDDVVDLEIVDSLRWDFLLCFDDDCRTACADSI